MLNQLDNYSKCFWMTFNINFYKIENDGKWLLVLSCESLIFFINFGSSGKILICICDNILEATKQVRSY